MPLFRSLLLTSLALLAAVRTRDDRILLAYFGSEVLNSLAFVFAWFRVESDLYMTWFVVGTFLTLSTGCAYVMSRYEFQSWKRRCYALVEYLMLSIFLILFMRWFLTASIGSISRPIAISVGNAGALLGLAVSLGVVAGGSITAWSLTVLWASLGLWNYAFTFGFAFSPEVTHNLNQWVPSTISSVCFAMVAIGA